MNTNATHSEMPTLLTPADAATILHVPVKTLAVFSQVGVSCFVTNFFRFSA